MDEHKNKHGVPTHERRSRLRLSDLHRLAEDAVKQHIEHKHEMHATHSHADKHKSGKS